MKNRDITMVNTLRYPILFGMYSMTSFAVTVLLFILVAADICMDVLEYLLIVMDAYGDDLINISIICNKRKKRKFKNAIDTS